MKIKIEYDIPAQRLADLMTTLIESGDPVTRSWLKRVNTTPDAKAIFGAERGNPWYANATFWEQPTYAILMMVDKADSDDTGERFLSPVDFAKGFELLANTQDGAYAHHFKDFLTENEEATTRQLRKELEAREEAKKAARFAALRALRERA
jgi:hypothetical protein